MRRQDDTNRAADQRGTRRGQRNAGGPARLRPEHKDSDTVSSMTAATLIAAIIVTGGVTIYFAIRSREFRKFLAGAFFVSSGVQFYLYLTGVSIPLLGTGFVQTPRLSAVRASIHFALFAITFYFGFLRKPRAAAND
jgi:hypothetical protein